MSRQPSSFPTDVKHCLGRPSSVQIGRSTTMAASTCPNAFDTSLCLESTTTGTPAAALPVHRQATRYADDLPRDEACLVASEEGHNACEVSRRPIRRNGTDLIIFSRILSASVLSPPSKAASIIGVFVGPGATVLNVTPFRANSRANVFDIAITPALQPAYTAF